LSQRQLNVDMQIDEVPVGVEPTYRQLPDFLLAETDRMNSSSVAQTNCIRPKQPE
jgi:hypothetical protein